MRIATARDLLGAARTGLGAAQERWKRAIGEYEAVQLSLAERAEANLNLAMLYQASGRAADAAHRAPLPGRSAPCRRLAQGVDAHGLEQRQRADQDDHGAKHKVDAV